MTSDIYDRMREAIGPLRLPQEFCPWEPTAKQEWFLRLDALEAFFGGSAGPGKSVGLLMAALQYVDVPGYHALILRTHLKHHTNPKALIPISQEWLASTRAGWNGTERRWTFPSGATLQFGYVRTLTDMAQWKGPAYSFLGFDELTEFEEQVYRAMSRVLRDAPMLADGKPLPLRKRSASNPGGPGHGWVKSYMVDQGSRPDGVVYVPAHITDNPHMNYDEYMQTLSHLSPVDQMRLINGDWDVMEEGGKFKREDFIVIDAFDVKPAAKTIRYWDLAGSEPTPSYPDPDYTVGLRLEQDAAGTFTITDLVRGRWGDATVEQIVRDTAEQDGRGVPVYIEQDPGQAGKAQISNYQRRVLAGFPCHAGQTKLDGKSAAKEVRARAVSAAVANHLVQIVRGDHLFTFLGEAAMFPNGAHDDLVDALSGAHRYITQGEIRGGHVTSAARRRLPGMEAPQRTSYGR